MITIVNYGLGNISAFVNMYKRMNISTHVAKEARDLQGASHVIIPGVGAFDHAMKLLQQSGMREPLEKMVLENGVPVLGVCVGMQILAESSDEGIEKGLGWIRGRVRHFGSQAAASKLPLPHMGWNDVQCVKDTPLFKNFRKESRAYFLHSYYFECEDPSNAIAIADYGLQFACAVERQKIYGVQFHPEKSHHWGSLLLKSFAEI